MSKKKFVTEVTVVVHHNNGMEDVYPYTFDGTPTNDALHMIMDRYNRKDVHSIRVENYIGKCIMMRYGAGWDVFGIRRIAED